jgi:hypothetical protein
MNQTASRRRMQALAEEPDRLRRRLIALGLVTAELASSGIVPILVGGTALELYTAGGYTTGDVDLALPSAPEVNDAFSRPGFERMGRFWVRADLDLLFEAPAPAGLPGEDAPRTVLEIEGLHVHVIGIADLLIDRLRGWVHSRDEDARWTRRLALLHADRIDWSYARSRVEHDCDETSALDLLLKELT